MKLIFASTGIVQTGGLVCGSVTLFAAHLANLISLDKWSSTEITTVITEGSKGPSLGSIFDEDYIEEAKNMNLNINNQFIADGIVNMKVIDPIIIKNGQMMALTCAGNGSVGHHMFLCKQKGIWYWLESLPCDHLGNRTGSLGTGCMRIFSDSTEFEDFFIDIVTGQNWSLRGISVDTSYLLFPDKSSDGTYNWVAYTLPDMSVRIEHPLSIQKVARDQMALVARIDIPKFSIIPLFEYPVDYPQQYKSKMIINSDNQHVEVDCLGLFLKPFVIHNEGRSNSILRELRELKIATDLFSGYVIQTTRHIAAGENIAPDQDLKAIEL
jgi:hypothetical protein